MSDNDTQEGHDEWGGTTPGLEDQSFPTEPAEVTEHPGDISAPEPVESASNETTQEVTEKKQKNRVPGKTRINELRREKYRAEHEAQVLRAENERLKKQSETSNYAAMTHYDSTIQLKLDQAKRMKAEAIQAGDVDAQVTADVELSRVAAQLEQMEAYKAQQKMQQTRQQEEAQQQEYEQQHQQYNPEPQDYNEETENWLQENTWFVPNSPDFDPDMYDEVRSYANALDRKLKRQGREDEILSKDYFDEINNYVAREFNMDVATKPANNKGLNMKAAQSRAPVAPVGRAGGPASAQQKVVLTASEKEMARLCKKTDEEWMKHKIADMKYQQSRGEQRRG